MKILKIGTLIGLGFFTLSCSSSREDDHVSINEECYVILYENGDLTGAQIQVYGPRQYPNLDHLPNTTENWDGRAQGFKSGSRTAVAFFGELNYQGSQQIFNVGSESGALPPVKSMLIECK